jgi:hypothetical protein
MRWARNPRKSYPEIGGVNLSRLRRPSESNSALLLEPARPRFEPPHIPTGLLDGRPLSARVSKTSGLMTQTRGRR